MFSECGHPYVCATWTWTPADGEHITGFHTSEADARAALTPFAGQPHGIVPVSSRN
jgi:hypothetical protein